MRTVLKSKIHRCWVTGKDTDYIGSVSIDKSLMEKSDIWDFEKVLICNATNGHRWETYVLPAERGSGIVSVQGAGARLCEVGDCLIILAFEATDSPIEPKMILVDQDNRFLEFLGAEYAEQVR